MKRLETFLRAVLADVPPGRYKSQAETELRDHIETGCEELSGGGKTHREAVEEVLHTMGDPETLRKEYDAAWRRRELSFFWPLYTSLLLYALAIALTVPVYLLYPLSRSFFPRQYILWAVPLAAALICAVWVRGRGKWTAIALICGLCAIIQLLPMTVWVGSARQIEWMSRAGEPAVSFYFPCWVGVLVHVALEIWGLVNFGVARSKRRRRWERRAA